MDSTGIERRTALKSVFLPLLFGWDFFDDDEITGATIAVDTTDTLDEYDPDEYDAVVAIDTGAIYQPNTETGGWKRIKSTGENPSLGSVVVDRLRTRNVGVSAGQSTNLDVASGTETRLALDDTTHPYFDSFGELDAVENEIVVEHDSHHTITAHGDLGASNGTGQIWLRVYVNGTEYVRDHTTVSTGEQAVLECTVDLKLDRGDKVYATVDHDTGSTETFGADAGNFVSCIRQ